VERGGTLTTLLSFDNVISSVTCCNISKDYLFIVDFYNFLNFISIPNFTFRLDGALLPPTDVSEGVEATVSDGVTSHAGFVRSSRSSIVGV